MTECTFSNEADRRDADAVTNFFTYHKPRGNQAERHEHLKALGKHMALEIIRVVPPGADRTAAIRKLRECVMTASAGIACGEAEIEDPRR